MNSKFIASTVVAIAALTGANAFAQSNMVGEAAYVVPAASTTSNVTRARFDYAEALSQSWKRQTLMNVVHLRYADAPFFLDVTSLINTYTRTNNVTANASLRANWDDSSLGASASGTWNGWPDTP